MDTQIARHVLGVENIDWVCAIPVSESRSGKVEVVPHYSTDLDEARAMGIELERRGYMVAGEHLPGTRMERIEIRTPQTADGETRIYSATAATRAEATCRAALLAVLNAEQSPRSLRSAA